MGCCLAKTYDTTNTTSGTLSMELLPIISLHETVIDPIGFKEILKFSQKEYSSENLTLFQLLNAIHEENIKYSSSNLSDIASDSSLIPKENIITNDDNNNNNSLKSIEESLIEQMKKIEIDFLSPEAEYQMNTGYSTNELILSKEKLIEQEGEYTFYKKLHQAMLGDILSNVNDIYLRFLASSEYIEYLEKRQQNNCK
ncbi:hypothetical protein ABK040_002004 [Willaertia magna]